MVHLTDAVIKRLRAARQGLQDQLRRLRSWLRGCASPPVASRASCSTTSLRAGRERRFTIGSAGLADHGRTRAGTGAEAVHRCWRRSARRQGGRARRPGRSRADRRGSWPEHVAAQAAIGTSRAYQQDARHCTSGRTSARIRRSPTCASNDIERAASQGHQGRFATTWPTGASRCCPRCSRWPCAGRMRDDNPAKGVEKNYEAQAQALSHRVTSWRG